MAAVSDPTDSNNKEEQKAIEGQKKTVVQNIFDTVNGPLELSINLDKFKKEEISVNVDNCERTVTIEAKHTETTSTASVVRQFTRRFTVPSEFKLEEMTYTLENGALKITIPLAKV